MLWHRIRYFNTSNVTIQQHFSHIFVKFFIISIHLMLLFNILCAIPSQSIGDFNTSNVTIQQLFVRRRNFVKFHFNTSNVTIQLYILVGIRIAYAHFNTSNVTIQPCTHGGEPVIYSFQYI